MLAEILVWFDERGTGKTKMRIHMNRLRNIVSLVAVCATAAFFTGCGEDDTPGDSGPQSNAPESVNARTYNLTDAGGTTVIAFNADGTAYTLTPSDGSAAENGTFTPTRNGEAYNIELNNPAAGTNSLLVLTFTGPGTGTYTFDRPGQDQIAGNFAAAAGPDPGPTTTTTTDDGNTTTNTTTGNAPATLTALTFTTGPGVVDQGTVITTTFNNANGTFSAQRNDGQPMGSGNFTYTPNGNNAQLVMTYAGSTDADNFTLTFNGGGTGTYSGTQTSGNNPAVAASGTFTY
jgi:hypothetical protein